MSAATTGHCYVRGQWEAGRGETFSAVEAATGTAFGPRVADADAAQVDAAARAAGEAVPAFAATPASARAGFLRAIAEELLAQGDDLLALASRETALPLGRLQTERARTVFQLRTFADAVDEGSWVDARIDRADETRQPQRKPDLRAMLVPLGPVAVFGSSNFPFAYSVAGGDTASALAVGCPVVVKAHPMHPGTGECAARAIASAARRCGMPDGVFGFVHGRSHAVGAALVQHPSIAAVGFTGSVVGGTALWRLANARPQPVPVFAEMGSANPVLVLPEALQLRGREIAAMLAASGLLACGQFCTSPGLVFCLDGPGADEFAAALGTAIGASAPGTFVHPDLGVAFRRSLAQVEALPGVTVLERAKGEGPGCATVLTARGADLVREPRLREEVYGPAMVLVRCADRLELEAAVASLHGHLTATVHGSAGDVERFGGVIGALQRRVGRLVFGGVPTGVEVAAAMQHGGPWPASSDARFTAVGPRAMLRWVRSLAWQDAPAGCLPAELQDGNPRSIWRTVDGVRGRH